MARILAHIPAPRWPEWSEMLRICIVSGCALALITAGQALPF